MGGSRPAGLWLLALCLAAAGCASDPDPYERQQRRLEAQRTEAERAKAQREIWQRSRREREAAKETPEEIRRALLAKYGPALTPFQRSKLLSTPIASREEGEAMCRRWLEENRRFEAGRAGE